jgi:hypothetical protein
MPLEHQQEQQEQAAARAASAPAVRLTPEELSLLLDEAIARHSEAERREHDSTRLATLDDAIEIAQQLNIPEEHVRSAARTMERRKRLEQGKAAVRRGRRTAFRIGLGIALAATLLDGVLSLFVPGSVMVWMWAFQALPAWVVAAVFAWWLSRPVTDAHAERWQPKPVPGECRVCGAEAYSPRATFCEEHRYKGASA